MYSYEQLFLHVCSLPCDVVIFVVIPFALVLIKCWALQNTFTSKTRNRLNIYGYLYRNKNHKLLIVTVFMWLYVLYHSEGLIYGIPSWFGYR